MSCSIRLDPAQGLEAMNEMASFIFVAWNPDNEMLAEVKPTPSL
jgi:hypothetical protein